MRVTSPPPKPKRILYVEDHQDSREMLTLLLEYDGYEVATAATMADGLNRALFEFFDLYILDSRFPDGTVRGQLSRLKRTH